MALVIENSSNSDSGCGFVYLSGRTKHSPRDLNSNTSISEQVLTLYELYLYSNCPKRFPSSTFRLGSVASQAPYLCANKIVKCQNCSNIFYGRNWIQSSLPITKSIRIQYGVYVYRGGVNLWVLGNLLSSLRTYTCFLSAAFSKAAINRCLPVNCIE